MRIISTSNPTVLSTERFSVFYISLTEDQRRQMNSEGWDGTIGTAYLDAKGEFGRGPYYGGSIQLDLFELAAEITAIVMEGDVGPDQVWSMLQNHHSNWSDNLPKGIETYTSFPRSMDIGDIVYSHSKGKWYRCASIGFDEIEYETDLIEYLTEKANSTSYVDEFHI